MVEVLNGGEFDGERNVAYEVLHLIDTQRPEALVRLIVPQKEQLRRVGGEAIFATFEWQPSTS